MRILSTTLLAVALLTFQHTAFGAVLVVGGSLLNNAADATQIETWLGQGSITLTNIFDKTYGDGKTAFDFHAAVDRKGRTIVLYKVMGGSYFNGVVYLPISPQVIGGYNPLSWNNSSGFNLTPEDADRKAFIFNLTSGEKQNSKRSTDPDGFNGRYQAYNDASYGPTFGWGHDIYSDYNLQNGFVKNNSMGAGYYGHSSNDPIIIEVPDIYSYPKLVYGEIEVYTISAFIVPEPASITICVLMSGLGCAVARTRKRA